MTNQATTQEIREQCNQWRDADTIPHCYVRVWWSRNNRTHEITVTASLGVAPDSHTIILYPFSVYKFGYWGKGETRKQMAAAKRELLAEMATAGWTRKMLTEPIEEKSLEYF